jgi:hypothetical protein
VTVRADDIALGHLGQDRLDPGPAHELHDVAPLRGAFSMVEVHRTWGESTAAVRTGNGLELVQDVGLVPPPSPTFVEAKGGSGGRPRREPQPMLGSRSKPVAIGADDVAFRGLSQQLLEILECSPPRTQDEGLRRGVAMVKVHLVRLESAATISARHVPQRSQERCRGVLPTADASDFLVPIGDVVADVRGRWSRAADMASL